MESPRGVTNGTCNQLNVIYIRGNRSVNKSMTNPYNMENV